MLIRTTVIALALAGCLDTAPPPDAPLSAVAPASPPAKQPRDAFCDHRLYKCRPNDPSAQFICDQACLFPSHCQDYTAGDYRFCATHPDSFDRYFRYCDPWGNPSWDTFCIGGQRP
jgi:hypothetical protein